MFRADAERDPPGTGDVRDPPGLGPERGWPGWLPAQGTAHTKARR